MMEDYGAKVDLALKLFRREAGERLAAAVDLESKKGVPARRVLGDALILYPGSLSAELLHIIDEVYAADVASASTELPGSSIFALASLPGLKLREASCTVVVWRGDITRLAADAVVNAANEEGLGCFQPSHRCIDNVLHRAAGPRLREECRGCMARRGQPLAAGTRPLLTGAHNLPAKAVLHVTGPRIAVGAQPTPAAEGQLRAAYTGCLDTARENGLRSIAFCCISTGLFGYPQAAASEVALRAVKDWLTVPGHSDAIDYVIFDVFTDADERAYTELAPRIFAEG
ncbi:unnamed protein product [Polarella glacialis]|uniref:Macro domain-containing protein n=1 Tax=Polarella glacialis TaxID=89957 RepID=A0A813LX08_POLGL|nr:unnamed protein product [Polarella glacialis]CAE8743988.1 unnamed protein product [Polarella glacialis]